MWKVQTYKVTAEPDALVFIYLLYGHLVGLDEEFKSHVDRSLESLGDQFANSAMVYSPMKNKEGSITKELEQFRFDNRTSFDPVYQMGLLVSSKPLFELSEKDSLHLFNFKKNDTSSFNKAVETVRRVASEHANFAFASMSRLEKEQTRNSIVERLYEAISAEVPLAPGVKLDLKRLVTPKR